MSLIDRNFCLAKKKQLGTTAPTTAMDYAFYNLKLRLNDFLNRQFTYLNLNSFFSLITEKAFHFFFFCFANFHLIQLKYELN